MDRDDTLDKDAGKAVRRHLNLPEEASDDQVRQVLGQLIARMELAQTEAEKPQKGTAQRGKTQQGGKAQPQQNRGPQGKAQQSTTTAQGRGAQSKTQQTPQAKAPQGKASKEEVKTTGPSYDEVSLAIEHCPTDESFAAERKRLRILQVKLQSAETLQLNPKLCIQFEDLTWIQYYSGTSNIKYPDVRGMEEKFFPKLKLQEKMMLFDLLQGERHQCCMFNPAILTPFQSKKEFEDCPALIIPSGGKGKKWLKDALADINEFWWLRCLKFAQVIFAVSNEEFDNYKPFTDLGVTVVGYEGFGMGCGRAAGIEIAKRLGRVCIMTDDRTKGLTWEDDKQNNDLTKEELMSLIAESDKTFIVGVQPKGELNILTIINPLSTQAQQPVFSPYFIASKEDKALYQYCLALQMRYDCTVGETDWTRRVRFDAKNPVYDNKAPENPYPPLKDKAMRCIMSSQRYCSLESGTPLDWQYLNGRKQFLNPWDAVKMQDSAMFLLLVDIVKQIELMHKSEGVPPTFWDDFDKYIAPWFS